MSGPQNESSQRRWDALGELARAATPGPWGYEAFQHRVDIDDSEGHWMFRCGADAEFSMDMSAEDYISAKNDASFIAAASPDVVLALIAELGAVRLQVEAAETERDEAKAKQFQRDNKAAEFWDQIVKAVCRGPAWDAWCAFYEADPRGSTDPMMVDFLAFAAAGVDTQPPPEAQR